MPSLLDVRPTGYSAAARVLGNEVAECTRLAWVGLQRGLDGTSGMAGSDGTGSAWGASYDNAAATATAATQDIVNACYHLAALIEQTGINYDSAEAASVPGETARASRNRWAGSSVAFDGLRSAVGFGVPAPMGWDTLQHAIGLLWPDGHQDLLHTAADAWARAGGQLNSLLSGIDRAGTELMLQRAPEVEDACTVVDGMRGHLADLAATYLEIGSACTEYAHHLDQAHHAIIEEIKSFIEITVAIEAAGGLFAIVTLGISEALAQGGEAAEIARAASAVRAIIQTLSAVAGELGVRIDAVGTRIAEIAGNVRPVLAKRLQEVRLAAANDRGEIVIGRKLASQTDGATAGAATTPETVALNNLELDADIGPASETWADRRTLARHFRDHRQEVGAVSEEDYARKAALFYRRAKRDKLPMKVDESDGTVRFYDPRSNTFGAYRLDGTTRTFYKPTSREKYWQRQPGVLTND